MRVVAIQSNYLPWKGYFDLIHDADLFLFYDEVQYTKNDWRNRNQIYTANGLQWLTVPMPKAGVRQKISEVEIVDSRWQRKHYRSLHFGYGGAPFFAQIKPFLEEVYLGRKWEKLVDLNRFLIQEIARRIGIDTEMRDSKEFDLKGDRVERLLSLLQHVGASEYVSGPNARGYLEPCADLFEAAGVRLRFKEYRYPKYSQLRQPFVHEVSIVDMLANLPIDRVREFIWETPALPADNFVQEPLE